MSTVSSVLAAALLASCGGDHPKQTGEPGSISLELVAHTPGATYHLRMASFAIAGPTTTTLTTEGADSEAASLTAKLSIGHYAVTLADGWALYRAGDTGSEVRVAASLLSSNPASFDVTAGATTFVPFRFATDGLVIATGPSGAVEISTEVNELHGLALLAGDPTQAGSADGVGAAARFDTPTTLVADGQGNLYINDSHNLTIRKLVVATGQVTTLAGSPGQSGYTDGVGAAARFVFPYGMALDAKGNLFVSDQFHLRRLVVATGEVIDLGIADAPEGTPLSISGALAVESSGAPLVIEALQGAANLPLRAVDLQSRTASQLSSWATPSSPVVVPSTVDAMTTVTVPALSRPDVRTEFYLVEGSQTKIEGYAIYQNGGVFHFVTIGQDGSPGTADGNFGAARFMRPAAIASDPNPTDDSGYTYVADPPAGTIRKIEVRTSLVTTVVGQAGVPGGPKPGPLPALLGRPVGVAVLPNGALAIADGNAIYIARF